MKGNLRIFYYLLLFLIITTINTGCFRDRVLEDNSDWENEVLMAQECGLERLRCCLDKDPVCDSNLSCCLDPNNNKNTICTESCECGRLDAFCCANELCGDGMACNRSFCRKCGESEEICCFGEDKCAGDMVCHRGLCVECGIHGNPCCGKGQPCVDQGLRDKKRTECRNGLCLLCGYGGNTACESDPFCSPGQLLNNNVCYKCGGANEPCCLGDEDGEGKCNDPGFNCELGFCAPAK